MRNKSLHPEVKEFKLNINKCIYLQISCGEQWSAQCDHVDVSLATISMSWERRASACVLRPLTDDVCTRARTLYPRVLEGTRHRWPTTSPHTHWRTQGNTRQSKPTSLHCRLTCLWYIAHFTIFFCHNLWKFNFPLIQTIIIWSLQNFVHVTTAVLSWHVLNFVAIY